MNDGKKRIFSSKAWSGSAWRGAVDLRIRGLSALVTLVLVAAGMPIAALVMLFFLVFRES